MAGPSETLAKTLKMNQLETESGYIALSATDCHTGSSITNPEVIRVTKTNNLARGRRYGRQWFLKGLREELRDSAVMQRQLQKEFEIHSRLRHPSIVQVIGLENVDGLGLCIVEEWVDGITLHEALSHNKLKSSERRRIIRNLVEAVAYLHSQGVVHRDLKPSNIIIRDIGKEMIIIDFGLSDTSDYVELKGAAGTPGFVSPEQIKSGGADPADDIYSIGVIMKILTPHYSSIARRCMAPAGKRPADAGQLQKMILSHDRRPKIIMGLIGVLAVVAAIVFGVLRIHTLEQSAYDSAEKVSKLRTENSENLALIASLNDSLSLVRGYLDEVNDELARITDYEKLKKSIYSDGCRRIDDIMIRADRNVFSKISRGDLQSFNENLSSLLRMLEAAVDEYYRRQGKTSTLSKEDVESLRMNLYNYEALKLSEYQEKWLKGINIGT